MRVVHHCVLPLQIFNVFLVTTISGSILKSAHEIIAKPTSITKLLATSLPEVGLFFCNYIVLQALSSVPMDLLRPGPLVVSRLKLWLLAKTGRERGTILSGANGACSLLCIELWAVCLPSRCVAVQAPWTGRR